MRYEKYNYSGIIWLGEIPAGWMTRRLKDIGKGIIGLTYSPADIVDEREGGLLVLRSSNIQNDKIDFANNVFVNIKPNRNLIVRKGDILICSRNGSRALIGKNICIDENSAGHTFGAFMTVFRTKHFGYVSYYFKSQLFDFQSGAFMTSTINQLTINTLNNLIIPIPSNSEQTAIAQYLDTKTQAIDKKINLLTKKAETYKELRKSIINDAVCKGLDKNVKLKESGIYYINSIPIHWKIERIKDQFYIGRGRVIGQEALVENGKYPVYSSQTESNGCLGFIETFDFDKDLLTWTTDGANAGTVFRRSGKFNCTNVCGTLIPKKKNLDLNYVVYALQESATHNKRIDTNGAKIMNNEMAVIHIAFPPKEEQTTIANYLDEKTQKIDAIVSNIGKQIDTLKELRKTLINDVVTGKIKVINTPK